MQSPVIALVASADDFLFLTLLLQIILATANQRRIFSYQDRALPVSNRRVPRFFRKICPDLGFDNARATLNFSVLYPVRMIILLHKERANCLL